MATRDPFDDIWAQATAPQQQGPDDGFDAVWAQATASGTPKPAARTPSSPSVGRSTAAERAERARLVADRVGRATRGIASVRQGMVFAPSFADEAAAAVRHPLAFAQHLLPGGDKGEEYVAMRNAERADVDQHRQEAPVGSMGATLLGGLATARFLPGIATALKAGVSRVPGAGATAARAIPAFKTGAAAPATLRTLAHEGVALGAVAGAGEADEMRDVPGAATVGGGLGLVGGAATRGIIGAGSYLLDKSGLRGKVAETLNGVVGRFGQAQPKATPEEVADAVRKAQYRMTAGGESPVLSLEEGERMARARALGFNVDEPLYHGTGRSFDSFDVDRAGDAAGSPSQRAVFLSPDPKEASRYAEIYGSRDVAPGETAFTPGSPAHGLTPGVLDGANVLPVYARGRIKDVDAGRGYNTARFEAEIDRARKEGFDGARFLKVNESDTPSDQVAIFDPANLRSRFARFDPAQDGSADLRFTAGGSPPTGKPGAGFMSTIDDRAREMLLTAAERAGKSIDDIEKAALQAAAAGKPLTVQEILGQPAMRMARNARAVGTTGSKLIDDVNESRVTDRVSGALPRVRESLSRNFGFDPEDGALTAEQLVQTRRTNAGPAYDALNDLPPIQDPEILGLLDQPEFQSAYEVAARIARRDGLDVPDLATAKEAGIPVRVFDYMKQSLDDVIERGEANGRFIGRNEARQLRGMLNQGLDKADSAVPEYAAARGQYAGDSAAIDAFEQGAQDFSSRDMTAAQMARKMAEMDDASRELYRRSIYNAAHEQAGNVGRGVDLSKRLGLPNLEEKLRVALGEEGFERWLAEQGMEEAIYNTRRVTNQGSQTFEKFADNEDFTEQAVGVGADALKQDWFGLIRKAAGKAGPISAGVNRQNADALAPMLTAGGRGDSEEIKALIAALRAAEAKTAARRAGKESVRRATSAGSGLYGGGS